MGLAASRSRNGSCQAIHRQTVIRIEKAQAVSINLSGQFAIVGLVTHALELRPLLRRIQGERAVTVTTTCLLLGKPTLKLPVGRVIQRAALQGLDVAMEAVATQNPVERQGNVGKHRQRNGPDDGSLRGSDAGHGMDCRNTPKA